MTAEAKTDLIPCMVTVRKSDGAVSVLPLLETPIGLALHQDDTYRRVGQVQPTTWTEENSRGKLTKKTGTAWYFDDVEYGKGSGRETTAKAALTALLRSGGYVEAPPNAANPGLFA